MALIQTLSGTALAAMISVRPPLVAAESSPDANPGAKVFATCAACHGADQPTRTGPELRGIFGRTSGSVAGFRYSRAMKNARIVWNEETLAKYLADPQGFIPGNAMPFPGLPDEQQRRDVIAFLKTLK